MSRQTLPDAELYSLRQVSAILRRAHKPRHPQTLYDRIRRGTLTGVQQNGRWYVPRYQLEQLLAAPYHRRGGRPRIQDTETMVRHKPRRRIEIPDAAEVVRVTQLSVEQRCVLAFRAHAAVRNTLRANLTARFPDLSPRELSLFIVAELSRA